MPTELPSSEEDVKALLESAVSSRASHIRRESQTITMANVRRLLESDLGLENSALDAHKSFIKQLVDEVMLSSDNVEAQEESKEEEEEETVGEEQKGVFEEVPKKKHGSKQLKRSSDKTAKQENGSVEDFNDVQEEDINGEAPKKRKHKKRRVSSKEEEDGGGSNADMSEEEVQVEAQKKQQKERKEKDVSHSKEEDETGGRSEEDSDVSEVKKSKKVLQKIASVKPAQNKKIEHLKKVIKACGLIIPPQLYKRAKQQPEDKHDHFLIKELEEMLSQQGLSSNPSDKEIKAAKKKIAREKDLEGIDTTNIILEPRGRRATSQLFAPVYNPPPVEFDSEADDDEESEDGVEGSEDEGKEFAVVEESEDSE